MLSSSESISASWDVFRTDEKTSVADRKVGLELRSNPVDLYTTKVKSRASNARAIDKTIEAVRESSRQDSRGLSEDDLVVEGEEKEEVK